MTVAQAYTTLSQRMLSGIMLHSDLVDYYKFLSLDGYAKCHEYRMIAESHEFRKLKKHYLKTHDRLIQDTELPREQVIPDAWYSHVRQDVDPTTLKEAVKDGITLWIEHETETKRLYEDTAKHLRDLGDVEGAIYVERLVSDVSKELARAKKYHLIREHVEYDLPTIIGEQKCIHEKYECKIKECYRA